MTAHEGFGRLLYTDTDTGFRVQARSADVNSALSELALGQLLYEVQDDWLRDRRPVEDFPLGFAHYGDAGYGTAQGRYLGKTVTGGRHGNHLTDCLLTSDPDLYGTLRPAQLWRSELWRPTPWPARECPSLPADDLTAGPLTVTAVGEWARARPRRGTVLARLLTMLEDPGGRRVVIVSDDPDEAMTWIAAATLLLPAREALRVSFKVFSSIPLRAAQRIAAAPAALFPRIAPGQDGPFVLDARSGTADEVTVSERAAFFTAKLTADGDPYDVIDAVELAAALSGPAVRGGPSGHDARLTAWALIRSDEPVTDPEALFRWLTTAPAGLFAEYGSDVAEMIMRAAPEAGALRWIDRAVTGRRLAADLAAVRTRLLTAELAEVRDGKPGIPVTEVLPAVPLSDDARRDAESELSSALLLSSASEADLLLCLARRHGIAPDVAPPVRQRLSEFASGWIDHPEKYHPDGWLLRQEIIDLAYDQLRDRLAADGIDRVRSRIQRLGQFFADREDLTDPLDCQLQASFIAQEHRQRNGQRLVRLLDRIRQHAGAPHSAATAAQEASGLQQALLDWRAVDERVAFVILSGLPGSVDVSPEVAGHASRYLARLSAKPTAPLLGLIARLDRQGLIPSPGPLARLAAADRSVRSFVRRTAEDRLRTDQSYLEETVRLLCEADHAVIRVWLDAVLGACLQARHPQLGALVLARLEDPLPQVLAKRWAATLGSRDLADDGVWCVHCLDFEDLPAELRDQLKDAVRSHAKALPEELSDAWYAEVARRVEPRQRDLWASAFTNEPRPGLARLLPQVSLRRGKEDGRNKGGGLP
jgi:hypothetical protein